MGSISISDRINNLVFRLDPDPNHYRRMVKRTFWITLIYSIVYGVYEYFIVYTYVKLVDRVFPPQVNWAMMYSLIILILFITSERNVYLTLMGLLFMVMFEDVIYFMCAWVDWGYYPYPTYDWWSDYLATFRVLGHLGRAIPFFPYTPLYYIPGFSFVIIFYSFALYKQESGRIAAWIIVPIFLGIILGTLYNQDWFAWLMIFMVSLISYIFLGISLWYKKRHEIPVFS